MGGWRLKAKFMRRVPWTRSGGRQSGDACYMDEPRRIMVREKCGTLTQERGKADGPGTGRWGGVAEDGAGRRARLHALELIRYSHSPSNRHAPRLTNSPRIIPGQGGRRSVEDLSSPGPHDQLLRKGGSTPSRWRPASKVTRRPGDPMTGNPDGRCAAGRPEDPRRKGNTNRLNTPTTSARGVRHKTNGEDAGALRGGRGAWGGLAVTS